MSFADRAVSSCIRSFEQNTLSSRSVRDILSCDEVDVTPIEPFLNSKQGIIRMSAVTIIGAKGDMGKLVEAAKFENDRMVLMMILNAFRERPDGAERVVDLLESEDEMVFEETIEMFRRAGREDCLFGLIFSQDKDLVERVKRYINEHKQRQASSTQ
jgi:hypothetical protein